MMLTNLREQAKKKRVINNDLLIRLHVSTLPYTCALVEGRVDTFNHTGVITK